MRKKLQIPLDNTGKLQISKLDAAVGQLETAITLWFTGGNPVAICTLAFSGHEVMCAINRAKKGRLMLPDVVHAFAKKAQRDDLLRLLRLDVNFVKHGDKDPDESHFLTTAVYPIFIFDAVSAYNELGFPVRPLFQVFVLWVGLTEAIPLPEPSKDFFRQLKGVDSEILRDRRQFFEQAQQLLARMPNATA